MGDRRLGIKAHVHLLRHFSATELLAAGADLAPSPACSGMAA